MSKAKRIKELKSRFVDSINQVADLLGISACEVTRDEYTRVTVDLGIEGKLNKEELVEVGGFAKIKEELIQDESKKLPKILVLDIETSNIIAKVWGLWNNNVALNQVIKHSSIFSYAAKFIGDDKIYYNDTFNQKDKRDDKKIVNEIIQLINESDFVLGHNSTKFDLPRIRARQLINKLESMKLVQEIDTLKIAKKFLGFDSNKLEHLTHMLCTKHKKLIKKEFHGQELWNEFENGNESAQKNMKDYNILDILSLEELYVDHISQYDYMTPNFSSFNDSPIFRCNCGNDSFKPAGFHITKKSKFEKFRCTKCGKTHRSSQNLHSKEKRSTLLV